MPLPPTSLKRHIVDLLNRVPGRWVSTAAIADQLNRDDGYIRRVLNELADEGYVTRYTDDGRHVWTINR